MAYEIKSPLWGVKPGKRETRQQVITGISGTFDISCRNGKQILDCASQVFISPSMQVRDFTPFAKELINTGTVVIDSSKGRFFMWSMPPFTFEISQGIGWYNVACGGGYTLYVASPSGVYSVLLNPYIYLTSDITRLELNIDKQSPLYKSLFFRLSYEAYYGVYQTACNYIRGSRCVTGCSGSRSLPNYYSIQQEINYSDYSATNCMAALTLPQLLGVETWEGRANGFFIQSAAGGGLYSPRYPYSHTSRYIYGNMFKEGTTSLRARVFLPELFAPVADQPAILTTSAPIISGCIVRFVKTT